jgi:3-phenylpropionate/cinnamic acid dioxygenase small subunit
MSDWRPAPLAQIQLKYEIENFLYHEADLLDARRFDEWLELFSDDLVYFMPIRRNVPFGQHERSENTVSGSGISWFDEDRWTLGKRVEQIQTGLHFAEEPLSRTSHMVTNVVVNEAPELIEQGAHVRTKCRFLVYQNRVEYETYTFVGKRLDTLRRCGDSWQICHREIILDQNVLLAKNLSTFF